jgi:hypothetical protein
VKYWPTFQVQSRPRAQVIDRDHLWRDLGRPSARQLSWTIASAAGGPSILCRAARLLLRLSLSLWLRSVSGAAISSLYHSARLHICVPLLQLARLASGQQQQRQQLHNTKNNRPRNRQFAALACASRRVVLCSAVATRAASSTRPRAANNTNRAEQSNHTRLTFDCAT